MRLPPCGHRNAIIGPTDCEIKLIRRQNIQIAGKGHNVMLDFANPLVHTMAATDASDGHVSENGGTCVPRSIDIFIDIADFSQLIDRDNRDIYIGILVNKITVVISSETWSVLDSEQCKITRSI
jgi:hypothetical protein